MKSYTHGTFALWIGMAAAAIVHSLSVASTWGKVVKAANIRVD